MDHAVSLLEQLVTFAGHLAWPATVVLLVYLAREPIHGVIESLAARIRDPRSQLAISKEGIEIRTMIDAKLESIEIDQEQTKSLALQALRLTDTGKAPETSDEEDFPQELVQLADEYLKISHPDWVERVREKDGAARRMAELVITKGVSRDLLAGQQHEGLVLALATTIHTLPQPADIGRLLRVADEVNRLHVKYRIVLAVGRLFERQMTTPDDVPRIRDVLKLYKRDADAPLKRRIKYTEKTIKDCLEDDQV